MLDHRNIKRLAAGEGFDLCGIAPCRHLAENEARFREWLAAGYQSSLDYLERNADKRFDPRRLVERARTAVVCAVAYKNRASEGYPPGCRTRIASYACAADYHATIRDRLRRMLAALKAAHPALEGRAFVDTAPLCEKQLAVEAGLGWIGRQSLLVTPQYGSFVLLGELILTDEADAYDAPFEGGGLRPLPPLSRELPHGGSRPLSDARHGALHRLPHHRKRNPARRWISTAGYSAATPARAAVPTTSAHRSTATRRSIPSSIRSPWTRRRGSRWTKRASGSFSAARPSPAAACGASSETSAENDSTTARAERSRASAAPARPPSNGKRTFPLRESPLSHISPNGPAADRSPPGFRPPYFVNSVSAALAFSAAGPSVTFRKAAMAWSFISLAL